MHPQLDGYRSDFTSLKEEASSLVDDLDADSLQTSPDPETWSAAQCFDHLNTAGWLLLRSLEESIRQGRKEGPFGEPPFEYGFVSRWFVRSMEPSSGWTFTAPSVYEPDPPSTLYPNEAVDEFLELQDQFADCVEAADGLDLRRLRLPSPALPLLRISLGAWFEATIAHEHRHLKQAQQVLKTVQSA